MDSTAYPLNMSRTESKTTCFSTVPNTLSASTQTQVLSCTTERRLSYWAAAKMQRVEEAAALPPPQTHAMLPSTATADHVHEATELRTPDRLTTTTPSYKYLTS